MTAARRLRAALATCLASTGHNLRRSRYRVSRPARPRELLPSRPRLLFFSLLSFFIDPCSKSWPECRVWPRTVARLFVRPVDQTGGSGEHADEWPASQSFPSGKLAFGEQ
ncbi:hypothetical protein MRX96_026880 [Rhipicephalus microplus]